MTLAVRAIKVLGALLCLMLHGCATTPAAMGLKPPEGLAQWVTLQSDISHKYTGGFGREFEVGLMPVRMRLELEGSQGRYFLAEKPFLWTRIGDNFLLIRQAGIFLPSESSKPLRLYSYNHSGHIAFKSLDEVRAGVTKFGAEPSKGAGSGGVDAGVVNIAVQSNASPVVVGVGAAVGMAVVGAISTYDKFIPVFHPAEPSIEFSNRIKTQLVFESSP